MRIANSNLSSENVFEMTFVNPFDESEQRNFSVPLQDVIDGTRFTALKQFVFEKLKSVYNSNEEIYADQILWNKFSQCTSQIYQFNSIDTLITHLLKYREHLQAIPEYKQVLTYFNI